MLSMDILILVQVLTTFFMTGLIWVIQIVHYPLFEYIGKYEFIAYEKKHSKLISFIVAPMMLIELASAIIIIISNYFTGDLYILFTIAFLLLIIIWISTMLIQVPQHRILSYSYDLKVIKDLAKSNWIRTICWSLRSVILMYILYKK